MIEMQQFIYKGLPTKIGLLPEEDVICSSIRRERDIWGHSVDFTDGNNAT